MITLFTILASAHATEDKTQLIVSKSDFFQFIHTGILEEETVETIWTTLINEAEKKDPSKISSTGFSKSESYLFGVFPILSLIISVGSISVLLAMLWGIGVIEGYNKNYMTIIFTALSSLISITMSFTLYEAFGVVIVTWLLMMAGLHFLLILLETILISTNLLEENYELRNFNKYLTGATGIIGFVSYYYSLLIGFPLFQVPFFLSFWYIVGYLQKVLKEKLTNFAYLIGPMLFFSVSLLTLTYMLVFNERSFILIGNFQFVDFRFLGFFSSALALSLSFPYLLYKIYSKKHNIAEEELKDLLNKFFLLEVSQHWQDMHKYFLLNFLAQGFLLLSGCLLRSSSMIIIGYIGSLFSLLVLPFNKYSNLIYHLMYVSVILITSILGHLSDPHFTQFLVFYPNSYILSFGFLIVRIVLVIFGLINCNKFRTSHVKQHSSFDFILDFLFSYVQTVMLIVFSENEPNFFMSWAYFLFLVISIEPVIKCEPESDSDNVIKAFSMMVYGFRLAALGYSSWIIWANSLFVLMVGLFFLRNNSGKSKLVKTSFFLYLYLSFQYSCCLNSWVVVILIAGVLMIYFDFNDSKNSSFGSAVLAGVGLTLLSFFVSLKSICYFTCHIGGSCSIIANPNGSILEKKALESFLAYLIGD